MQQPQQESNEWSEGEPESERHGPSESGGAPRQGDPSSSTSLDAQTYLPDRRAWPRIRSDTGQVTLWTSTTESQLVKVHDESLTGLAILVRDVTQIAINRDVRLAFPSDQKWAIVRHIQPASDGLFRVGLEWGCSDKRFLSGNG